MDITGAFIQTFCCNILKLLLSSLTFVCFSFKHFVFVEPREEIAPGVVSSDESGTGHISWTTTVTTKICFWHINLTS